MNNLKHEKIFIMENNKPKELFADLKFMPDGRIKCIKYKNTKIIFRYSSKRITDMIVIKDDYSILELKVKYTKMYTKVIVEVFSDKLTIASSTGSIIQIHDVKYLHLYLMKYLDIPHNKTYLEIYRRYDKRLKHSEYQFTSENGVYKNIACKNVYCKDIITGESKLFQVLQHNISHSTYNLVYENIEEDLYYTYDNFNRLESIIDSNNLFYQLKLYNNKGVLEKVKNRDNTIEYEYDNLGRLIKRYDNGKLSSVINYVNDNIRLISDNDTTYKAVDSYYI